MSGGMRAKAEPASSLSWMENAASPETGIAVRRIWAMRTRGGASAGRAAMKASTVVGSPSISMKTPRGEFSTKPTREWRRARL